MIESDSREATDGTIFPFRAQPEGGIRSEHATKDVTDLYWLAFLLTGARDISIDIAADAALSQAAVNPFFATWFRAWSRKIVIAKAVAAIRDELRASVRRTEVARVHGPAPLQNWSLPASTTKTQIERALLAVDLFPKAAVLLSIFEGISSADAAAVLDADVTLVKKAQAIGARELTANLARKKDQTGLGSLPTTAWLRSAH
jgi:DNA-directed RNA polymerase specialized sigma24 family protein